MIIRKAEQKDSTRLLQLVKELAVYEKQPDAVTVSLQHFEESGFGINPVWWAFVAETETEQKEKTIIGFALYYIRYSTWKGQRMYLEDIIVTQSARGLGAGKLLFEALIQEAKERQLSGIVWQVLDWNEPAINFYKKYPVAFDDEWINCSMEITSPA